MLDVGCTKQLNFKFHLNCLEFKLLLNTISFSLVSISWTRLSTDHVVRASRRPPDKRYGHAMVTHDRHLYVFGGASGNILPKGIHWWVGDDDGCGSVGSFLVVHVLRCSFDLDEQMWLNIEIAEDSEVFRSFCEW